MTATAERPATTIFRRPKSTTGFWGWVTTVDHKKIGIMYGYAAFFFFILGGVEALLLRVQLAQADSEFLTAGAYNALFTMHGTTMIFLFVMPISAAFMNYLLPLLIGARDVAFPRLNALSWWIFLFGGIFLYSTFIFGTSLPPVSPDGISGNLAAGGGPGSFNFLADSPDGGWFSYQPNAGPLYSPGTALDFWALGVQLLGLASLVSAINFIVTMLNMRAKGMRLLRMPVFAWMTTVVAFLLLFSLPIIAIALFMVTFDRQFGTLFFAPYGGGDPILWQHLFWLFGHPEVYILILPAMGIVSEVLPVFSRKPLFGYSAVVFAGAGIAFLGFGVWAHHMFASGISPVAQAAFGLSTMTIAIPTGVKIFNWMGTMWGGRLQLKTPMLFAIGFLAMFTIGGLSGVTHSVVPSDWQQTDTYYIVAHFHYVLFGGAVFGIFAGLYYWFPKISGRVMSDGLGKVHFWLMFIGFNLTFAPMHWLGLQGMVRRTWKYAPEAGLEFWNLMETIGAFIIALSIAVFMYNWWHSRRHGEPSGLDPWNARTLEWSIPNPTPEYNYAQAPVVTSLDHFWHLKYDEDEEGRAIRKPDADEILDRLEYDGLNPSSPIHLPAPSYFPMIMAAGLPLVFYGIIYHEAMWGKALIVIGALVALSALIGWAIEPLEEPVGHHEEHDDDPRTDLEEPELEGDEETVR
ncbi:MAG TPA: cbb3-type cytochrome c oxidase subunit I [Acidimicrobiia bacterium]|jgi:cytochrome c oxidase subunit 1|nr:cbb3-type cytochrome c oxidase subunit I [Acidimicrobiia bacterium]